MNENRPLPLFFASKGMDAINFAISYTINLLELWFHLISKTNYVLIISYSYTPHIAPKNLNYRHIFHDFCIDDIKLNLPIVIAIILLLIIVNAGHIIMRDLSIIDNENIRKILTKGPRCCEPQSINRKYNFKLLMDSLEDYARGGYGI
jgi:hypothetical protein